MPQRRVGQGLFKKSSTLVGKDIPEAWVHFSEGRLDIIDNNSFHIGNASSLVKWPLVSDINQVYCIKLASHLHTSLFLLKDNGNKNKLGEKFSAEKICIFRQI